MPCNTLSSSLAHQIWLRDGFQRGTGLLGFRCPPTQLGDDIPDFLFGEQSLPFQDLHEGPQLGTAVMVSFGSSFSAMQRITFQIGVFNHLLIGCVHKPFCDLKIHFCERLTYSGSLPVLHSVLSYSH